eukprot:12906088-Prorocentrum_lima.AAC.1
MAARHHAILRQAFLTARASSEEEGLNFDPQQLLTEAVFTKDCLTTAGQYTPTQATPGYQFALLPDRGRGEAHCDDTVDDGVSRYGHRL